MLGKIPSTAPVAPTNNRYSAADVARLNDLDVEVRYAHHAPSYKDHPHGAKDPVQLTGDQNTSGVTCELVDRVTGKVYVSARVPGSEESVALQAAFKIAETTPKPLTAAQERDVNFRSQLKAESDERLSAIEAENAELKRRLKALEGPSPRTRTNKPATAADQE